MLAVGALTETVTTIAEGSFRPDHQLRPLGAHHLRPSSRWSPSAAATSCRCCACSRASRTRARARRRAAASARPRPNISGNRNSWNTVTVDGLVGNDLGSPQIFSGTINFDAISEVKVQLNNYQAENGRNGGAMISVVTKSGTKDYKGSAYAYKRHEKLNANDFFNNRSGIAKPLYRYTTLGATLGGPVPGAWRDKLFFFYSFENWDTHRAAAGPPRDGADGARAPGRLLAELQPGRRADRHPRPATPGRTSRATSSPPIGSTRTGWRCCGVFPLPNALDRSVTGGNYNYQFQESLNVPRHQHLGRVDLRPTAQDALYVRASTWYADNQGFAVPAGAANWGLLGQHYTFKDMSLIGNYTRILSASARERGLGRLPAQHRSGIGAQPAGTRRRDALADRLHARASSTPSINPLGIIPSASFTGAIQNPAAITFEGRFPLTGADTFFTVNDTASLARGDPTPSRRASTSSTRGTRKGRPATFNGNYEFNVDTTNPFDTRHPYANALLGVFRSYTESSARPGGDGTANVARVVRAGHVEGVAQADVRLRLRASRWYTNWAQKDGARRRRSRSSASIRRRRRSSISRCS